LFLRVPIEAPFTQVFPLPPINRSLTTRTIS
jgi:hypothetical protein